MSNILILGSDATYIRSRPAFAYSVDGKIWSKQSSYVSGSIHNQITASVINTGTGVITMVTNTGEFMTGSSLLSMSASSSIGNNDHWFSATGIATDNISTQVISGLYRDPVTLNEVGKLYKNSGGNYQEITTFPSANCSVLYNIVHIQNAPVDPYTIDPPVWIAVGRQDDYTGGIWWSRDLVTWENIPLPAEFSDRSVYDVVEYGVPVTGVRNVYFSCWGIVLSLNWLSTATTQTWSTGQELTTTQSQPDLRRLVINSSGEFVSVASGGIFHSVDAKTWSRFQSPGYQFHGVAWLPNTGTWIVGSESLLHTNQAWTSTDGTNWTGYSTGVNACDIVIVS